MRTTMSLDDEVYEEARRRAFEEKRSLGDVVSELARRGMQAERDQRPKRVLGQWAGQVWMADDFDATPEEWLQAVDEAIDPSDR